MMALLEVGYWSSSAGQFEWFIPGDVCQNGILKLVNSIPVLNLVQQNEMV